MFKRITLITLSLLIVLQSLPVVALNLDDYATEEELRQAIIGGAKWVEQFPNGLFNFLGTQFDIEETNKFLEIPVVRQGSTQGRVSVEFKAIDVSAKYGEDYVIRMYENAKKNDILKNEEAIPLIETVGDSAAINISESAAEAKEMPQDDSDKTEEEAVTQITPEPETQQDNEPFYIDLPKTDAPYGEGSNGQMHSLRQVRDAYLGSKSDRPGWKEVDAATVEKLKSEYDTLIYNMPGTEVTIDFEEGEYIKYLYVVPLNDSLSESEEQIMFALSSPEGGASRGEFYMGYVNIKDDEEPEQSLFEIETPTVTAKSGSATVTVRRIGGLYQYASVVVGTEAGTAVSGVDYEPGLSELFFTPGTSEQKVIVNIPDNPEQDGDKWFTVALDRENNNVNIEKAEAVVTLHAEEGNKNVGTTFKALEASAAQNTNAEKITPNGDSIKKGTWTINSYDFFSGSAPYYMNNIRVNCTNGIKFEFGGSSDAKSGNAYPISSLGGVDTISFDLAQNGRTGGASSFSLDRAENLNPIFFIRPKLNKYYNKISGIYNGFYKTPSFDANSWKNTKELVFTVFSRYSQSIFDFRNITLNLKELNTNILQATKLQKKKYTITNGKLSAGTSYQEYSPGNLYVKGVYSNVGNYQASPTNPKVYRSDRIEFGYQYSSDNPNGKYARFDGFEIKNGNNWIPFSGTELILNADFFKKTGIIDAVINGTIEIRPRFTKIPADVQINFDDRNNGWLKNATDKSITKDTYLSFENRAKPFFMSTFADIYVGDMLEKLTAEIVYVAKPPVWTSYGGDGYYRYTSDYQTPNSIIVTDPDANMTINYVLENKDNGLELNFREQTLVVKANPNTYKHGVTQPVYKLDGKAYVWSVLAAEMDRVWNTPDLNPLLEMEWNYRFDSEFPDKDARQEFGEPVKSYLTVFKLDGTQRGQYEVAYENSAFRFSGRPKDLGWEAGDYASIYIEGSNKFFGTNMPMKTQEVVIDFLSSTRDGIFVTLPVGEPNSQILAGGIQNPISITNANPLGYYKMQALLSPEFMVRWQDKSPDINGDGQYDDSEYEKVLKRFKAMGFADEHATELGFFDEKVYYGNYFSYRPGYFNPSKVYYTFERKQYETTSWSIGVGLYEQYFTVLNPTVMSYNLPIKDGEVYINGKRIFDNVDGVTDGKYKDVDPVYKEGYYYQGQLFYRGQTYNFAGQAGSYTPCTFTTSSLMKPYEFHAYVIQDSKETDQKLGVENTTVKIQDAKTKFTYRIDGSKAGVVPNDSRIRIYDNDGNVFMDVRTGAPDGEEFSYSLNPLTERIKPGYTMNISGILTDGGGKIVQEYPEVRVGLVFTQNLSGLSVLSSFKTPIKPVLNMIGKINNEYDLGMDIAIPDGAPEVYTDSDGRKRKIKTITFGFKDEYVKKFKEKSQDDTKEPKSNNKDDLEDETKGKDIKTVTKEVNDNKENPKGKSSGGGDFHMPYEISIAISLELGQKQGEDGLWNDDGFHYFSSLVLMATAKGNYEKSKSFMTPVGIPITITLSVGGTATAIIAADADHKDPYNIKYKLDSKDGAVSLNPANYDVYTTFIIQPYVTLSAGSGSDDIELTVSGTAKFDFKFTVPIFGNEVSSSGSGGLTLSAYLKLKILFIEKSWTLYKSNYINLFSYGKSWQEAINSALNNPYQDYLYEVAGAVSDEDIMPRNYIFKKGDWNAAADEDLPQGVKSGDENVLQTGTYPYPNTKLLRFDDNKTLLLFIEDDAERDIRNRASLMYSIIDGQSATAPMAIDPDGTWDENPDVFLIGDRVLVTWSDAGITFTPGDTQTDILSAMNISGAWLDPQTGNFSEPFEITKTVAGGDNYADLEPKISYDSNTKRLMVYYTKTDYYDRWDTGKLLTDPEEVPYEESPDVLYGDLINGYSVIAYRYADFDEVTDSFIWNETYLSEENLDGEKFYGQRFLSLAPLAKVEEVEHEIEGEPVTIGEGDEVVTYTPTYTGTTQTVLPYDGLDDPRIVEMDLTTHNSLAVLAYILDGDSDLKTQGDQQLFVQTYNYTDNTFSVPIEIANNETKDTQPRFAYEDGVTYLYWLSDGRLVYTNITDLLAVGVLKEVAAPGSDETFYIIDKTNTHRDAHIATAVEHDQTIDEYQIETDGDCVYAFWTEDRISYKNGLKQGDEGTEDPDNIIKERQIFAACTTTQTESDISFPWSKPIQVTIDEGQVFSDLSFAVAAEDIFTIAYARHTPQYDPEAGCFTSSNSNRTLAVNTFDITNDLELDEISLDKEFPLEGQTVLATTQVKNTGLRPFEGYETQVYVTKNGQTYYESEWAPDSQGPDYILGGYSETVFGGFVMPEDLDDTDELTIGFRVKNEAGEILSFREKEIPVKPDLQIYVLDSKLIGRGKAQVNIYVKNNGNKPFDDTLNVSAKNKTLHTQPVMIGVGESSMISLEVNLDGTSFDELQTAEDGGKFDLLPLLFKFGKFEGNGELKRQVSAEAFDALQSVESFIISKDGNSLQGGSKITIGYDDIVSLEKQVEKRTETVEGESMLPLEVVWESSNPDIVSVLPNGILVPMSSGTATITASLQPESEQSVSYENGTFEIIDTPYTIPEAVKKMVGITVNVKSSSSGGRIIDKNNVPNESSVNGTVKSNEKMEDDKLILSLDEKAFAETVAKLSGTLTVESSGGAQAKQVEATFTANNLKALEASNIKRLTINSTVGNISFDRKAIDAIVEKSSGKSVIISLDNRDKTMALTVKTENVSIDNLGGNIFISVPYTPSDIEDSNGLLVYHVNGVETANLIKESFYNPENEKILFKTNSPGIFTVGYNKTEFFDDLGWAKDYITFLSARNIVKGTAEGIFDKDKIVTRAEFVTMLSRLADDILFDDTSVMFEDIPSDAWYAQPVKWAFKNGIVNGTSEMSFSPDNPISREEMATMLHRYMEYAGLSVQKNAEEFKDKATFSSWAKDGIDAMKASGIIEGTGENIFEPQKLSSRAEAAKVIAETLKYVFR